MPNLLPLISQASLEGEAFLRADLTALEFEHRLLALGFYNVQFYPPQAAYEGVVYPLAREDWEMMNGLT